jgi:hypothetical protein
MALFLLLVDLNITCYFWEVLPHFQGLRALFREVNMRRIMAFTAAQNAT